MTKQIFTKTQAIAVLNQAKNNLKINLFAPVDPKHSLYKQSCDELEKKLHKYMDPSEIAGVVEDTEKPKTEKK